MQYLLSLRAFLVTSAIVASGLVATVILSEDSPAAMYITPASATVSVGETQQFEVIVKSDVAVNAFAGELIFDNQLFAVTNISYNTSIADLWVEEPWYNRAENSIYFAGGTTASGGFVGRGTLLTVTLEAVNSGNTSLSLHGPRIMAHDGLGSDVATVTPLDALFIADTRAYSKPILKPTDTTVSIMNGAPSLDINSDGKNNFQDIGVLLVNLGSKNPRYDFDGDGVTNWSDIREWQKLRREAN